MKRKIFFLIAITVLVVGAFAYQSNPAVSSEGNPVFVKGNPTCESLGYDFGVKFDYPEFAPGTYPVGGGTVTWSTDGTYVDWSSTIGIDAVIVKGGPNANLYIYDPPKESFGDKGLSAPLNKDKPYGLSHVSFCFDYELIVKKDAKATFTREYKWDIAKEKDGEYWKFIGDPAFTHPYKVSVKRTYVDSDWAVSGSIWIHNPAPIAATITAVDDFIDAGAQELAADVDCGVKFPYELPAGATLECKYSAKLGGAWDGTNYVTVKTEGKVGGGSAQAPFKFGEPTKVIGYKEVNVTDTNGFEWKTDQDAYWEYTKEFVCPTDKSLYKDGYYKIIHKNVAKIVETGQYDDATVIVHCYAPLVKKDAKTSFTRKWDWTIKKWGSTDYLKLMIGEKALVDYEVLVDATYKDFDWAVHGTIYVTNPNPKAPMSVWLEDIISPDILAKLDCENPLVVPAGETAKCGYKAELPDGSARINTATATLNKIAFPASADVVFGDPTKEIDKCVDVSDDPYGPLGKVCAPDVPKNFKYAMYVGPYEVCGDYEFVNVAKFITNDTGTVGKAWWTVKIHVPCPYQGCTPGYWKNHLDAWVGYSPHQTLKEVFGAYAPDGTLLEGLEFGGGGVYALTRHAVAALLNAAKPDVYYPYSAGDVIAWTAMAYESGEYEALKDKFEAANETFCPLN
jgi:hypothetical protein